MHKKKPRRTKLNIVSEELASSASSHLHKKLIPYSKICQDCHSKLSEMIDSARYQETVPQEDVCTSSGAQDSNIDKTVDSEDLNDETDKEIILRNMKAQFPNFTKAERVAIISVLPSSWTRAEICEKTGSVVLHQVLCKVI